ncbi:MAG: ATP-dependent DNA helicase [Bacteroidota bacterium]
MAAQETDKTAGILYGRLRVEPTVGQRGFVENFAAFMADESRFKLFILKGYAGTGKTTMMSALVSAAPALKMKTILLAPTGRAAKVISGYSGKPAFTIHKKIYQRRLKGGYFFFELLPNLHTDTLFIIDEASMISDEGDSKSAFFDQRSLLEDVLRYIYRGKNCYAVFVGDNAQLPPVGLEYSPALDVKYIEENFRLKVFQSELKEVVRQKEESGILYNATLLRYLLLSGNKDFPTLDMAFPDIKKLNGAELQDELESAFSYAGRNGVIIITRSNKRANLFNREVRGRVFWIENELNAGDQLMVVKNNYYWLDEKTQAGFIANGDLLEVNKVKRIYDHYGFRFADVQVRMPDYPEDPEMEVKLLLNTLHSESANLPAEELKKLFIELENEITSDPESTKWDKKEIREKVFKDPHYNALQVKFAWSVTCHKAQGGQWPVVFVDQGYLTEDMINAEFLRWLYTAVTRATEKLYLVNFDEKFFTA